MPVEPTKDPREAAERKALPFFVEFVKFASVFAVIVAVAMFTLRVTVAAQ